MTISRMGMADIIALEGIVPYRYLDSQKIDTDGVGNTAAAGDHDPAIRPYGVEIPMKEVIQTFSRNVQKFSDRVDRAVKVPTAQHEKDSLISFDLNTGGIFKAKLTAALNKGDRKAAAAGFMGWLRPPSIKGRRLKEQKLFRDGTYSSGGMANVYPADSRGQVLWSRGKRINVLPVIDSIMGAIAADSDAKKAAKGAVGTGGGAIVTGGGATQTPDLSQLPTDGGSLRVFLILLGIALGIVAVSFLIRWVNSKKEAAQHTDIAAAKLETEIANAAEGSAPAEPLAGRGDQSEQET